MPNFVSVLKDEIVRLARKEVRKELESLKKASSIYRSEIVELKRRITEIERSNARLSKFVTSKALPQTLKGPKSKARFSAKGFATHRKNLGLSASECAALLDVSALTVYNWESGKSKPRESNFPAILAFRNLGKREAKAELAKRTDQPEA